MKNHFIKIFITILCVLLLTGCHKLEETTIIKPNGSGELRMDVGFSAEERANMEKQNGNSQDFCNISQVGPNVTVTEEQRGDETWCITVTQFKDLDELRSLYEQRKGITINRLEISGDEFYYDIDMDTLSEDSNFSTLTDITWSLELPGTPIDHNADQVGENTLIWIPTPKSGVVNLRAESEVPKFRFPSCSAAFIGIGAGLIYWNRQGRKYSLK